MSAIPIRKPYSFPDQEITPVPPSSATKRAEWRREVREWILFVFICGGVVNYLVLGWNAKLSPPEAIHAQQDRSFEMARDSAQLSASAARASAEAVKALADALHKP